MKVCNHNNWCACEKYRSNVGTEHLGNQSENQESRMLRVPPANGGDSETDETSEKRRMDETNDRNDNDGERGYGAAEEDHILIFS